jgi:threonine aldolase
VQTNIVVCRVAEGAASFLGRLKEGGVLGSQVSGFVARFVTHRDVSGAQVDEAIERIRRVAVLV